MGSGTVRKENDAPIIKRPIKKALIGSEIPDIGGIAADVCIPSFDQKVKKNNLTYPGVKVRLQIEAATYTSIYSIYIGENVIGILNEKHSKMVKRCSALGVQYFGKIILKKGSPYARFTRFYR